MENSDVTTDGSINEAIARIPLWHASTVHPIIEKARHFPILYHKSGKNAAVKQILIIISNPKSNKILAATESVFIAVFGKYKREDKMCRVLAMQ
jgi:hypothetical protein